MQNQFLVDITNITNVLGQIAKIFWFTVTIIGSIWYFFHVLGGRKQIEGKQNEIFKVKKEIDDMMNTVHQKTRGTINQSQLEAITENKRIPLRAELETLKMQRQYLLDKISILNLLKIGK